MDKEKTFTDANFQTEVLQSPTPVLVDFWAEWCSPCLMLSPVIKRIAQTNEGKISVGKLNVDENPGIPQKYGIQGIPTVMIFKGGELAHQFVGFQSGESIQKALDELIHQ